MQFSLSDALLWAASTTAQVLATVLVFHRGLYRRLPFFTAYVVSVTFRGALLWWVYRGWGFDSKQAFYAYWLTQSLLLLTRGLVIAELCWTVLRGYRGIWELARRLLWGALFLLVANAALTTEFGSTWIAPFIVTAKRGLELAGVSIIAALLAICRYYRIPVQPPVKMLLAGLAIFSAAQVINDSLMQRWMLAYFAWWSHIHSISFTAMIVIWCLALRKPLPELQPAPVLLEQRVYDELTPQVSYRLRELNTRLLELLGG